MIFLAFFIFADTFEDIKSQIEKQLKTFGSDIAGITSITSFHTGAPAGFPGFDAGIQAGIKSLSPDISTQTVILPVITLEAGLPLGFRLTGKYFSVENLKLTSAGLTYRLLKLVKPLPEINTSIFYTKLSHETIFDFTDTSIAVSFGSSFPVIKPYAAIAYDMVDVKMKSQELSANTSLLRFQVGAGFSFLPLTYLNLGAGIDSGVTYQLGLGIKF